MVSRGVSGRDTRLVIGGLALLAAAAAIVVKVVVFPHFSLNHDEAVYLQHADQLLAGQLRLYPPVEAAFRPWFFVDAGDSLYSKYSPVTPAVYAVGKVVTGSYAAVLPVIAAGLTVVVGGVVVEAFDRRTGMVAAALFVASPMVVVQAGTFLPYAPTLLFEGGFALCYLRGERLESRWYAVAAGALIGVAFFARPYTAVVFGVPFIVHAVTRIVATWPREEVWKRHGLTAVLGLGGVVVALGYNWVLTGDPLVFPYQAFAPLDGPGFGRRELLGYTRVYDLSLAVASNLVALRLFVTEWIVGGVVTTALAVSGVGVVVSRLGGVRWPETFTQRQAQLVLVGVGVSVVVGNIGFWGSLNAVGDLGDPDGLATVLGPYYHFDLLVPTVAFAAAALVAGGDRIHALVAEQWDGERARFALIGVGVVCVVVLGGVTVVAASDIYERNAAVTETYESAYAPFDDAGVDDAVVLVPRVYGGWLNHPFQVLRNDAGFDGERVVALRETNTFAVLDAYPERSVYRYEYRGAWRPRTGSAVAARLVPVERRTGSSVTVDVRVGVPSTYESVSIVVGNGSDQVTYSLDWTGDVAGFELVLSGDGARLSGEGVEVVTGSEPVSIAGDLEVRAFLDTGRGAGITYRLDVPVTGTGAGVRVVSPYAEVCVDPRLCGGAAAAIPSALPPGVFVETSLNASGTGVVGKLGGEVFVEADGDDGFRDGGAARHWV